MDYPPTALTRSIKNGNTKKAAGVGRVGYVFVPIDRASDRSSWSRQVNGAIAWWHVWSEVHERSARKCLNREFSCLESRARPSQRKPRNLGTPRSARFLSWQEVLLAASLHFRIELWSSPRIDRRVSPTPYAAWIPGTLTRSMCNYALVGPGSASKTSGTCQAQLVSVAALLDAQLECQEKAWKSIILDPKSISKKSWRKHGETFLVFGVVGSGLHYWKFIGLWAYSEEDVGIAGESSTQIFWGKVLRPSVKNQWRQQPMVGQKNWKLLHIHRRYIMLVNAH